MTSHSRQITTSAITTLPSEKNASNSNHYNLSHVDNTNFDRKRLVINENQTNNISGSSEFGESTSLKVRAKEATVYDVATSGENLNEKVRQLNASSNEQKFDQKHAETSCRSAPLISQQTNQILDNNSNNDNENNKNQYNIYHNRTLDKTENLNYRNVAGSSSEKINEKNSYMTGKTVTNQVPQSNKLVDSKNHNANSDDNNNGKQLKQINNSRTFKFNDDLPDPTKLHLNRDIQRENHDINNNNSNNFQTSNIVGTVRNNHSKLHEFRQRDPVNMIKPNEQVSPESAALIKRDDDGNNEKRETEEICLMREQNRLSLYENASLEEQHPNMTSPKPGQWRPTLPKKPSLIPNQHYSLNQEVPGNSNSIPISTEHIQPKSVAMTTIVQEPNDELMVAASSKSMFTNHSSFSQTDNLVQNETPPSPSRIPRFGSVFSNDDNFNYSDDTDSSMAAPLKLNNKQRLLNLFKEQEDARLKDKQQLQNHNFNSKVVCTIPDNGTPSIISHDGTPPSGGPSSLVKRLARNFDRVAQENSPKVPPNYRQSNRTMSHQNNLPCQEPCQIQSQSPSINRVPSFDEDPKSESTWYDARSINTDLDEAEVADFLRNFDQQPNTSLTAPSGSYNYNDVNSSLSISTGVDAYVTVNDDEHLNNTDNTHNDLDDNDDTLNDNDSYSNYNQFNDLDIDESNDQIDNQTRSLIGNNNSAETPNSEPSSSRPVARIELDSNNSIMDNKEGDIDSTLNEPRNNFENNRIKISNKLNISHMSLEKSRYATKVDPEKGNYS